MTGSSNPLSYEATKIVLQYMEANSRFRISLHCPTLRRTEKVVPLRINSIKMSSRTSIYINEKEYKLGIIRKYPEGSVVPEFHQDLNERGGVLYDLDEYAISRDYTDERIDREIGIYTAYFCKCDTDLGAEASYYFHEKYRTELREFTNKRKKVLPPYTLMLQIITPGVMEQYKYTFDLPTAYRQLIKILFSGRREPALVKNWNLRIEISDVFEKQVKFSVCNLAVGRVPEDLENVAHMIHNSSLESLSTYKNVNDLDHPLEKTAKILKLDANSSFSEENIQMYSKLSNEHVILTSSNNSMESYVRFLRAIVRHWQEVGRKIGVTCTVKVLELNFFDVLCHIAGAIESLNGVKKADNLFSIPLNNRSEIHVMLLPTKEEIIDAFKCKRGFEFDGRLELSVVGL